MGRRDFLRKQKINKMISTFCITLILVACIGTTIFVMYMKSLEDSAKSDLLALNDEDEILSNTDTEATSTSDDKTVADNLNFKNEAIEVEIESDDKKQSNVISKEVVKPITDSKNIIENTLRQNENIEEQNIITAPEEIKLSFQAPINGEIIKDYSMDTLIYSKTLDEWCTHSGIDIKANKASVVVASEAGKIESIKNDPRYGLTIIISHANGFKTVYSNLLTTEFVSEGEEVEKGQTIATVGESASFEISDETHLHFEMYKDEITVNPTIYFE